jgi:F-type H+-transporting ATPase subunit b
MRQAFLILMLVVGTWAILPGQVGAAPAEGEKAAGHAGDGSNDHGSGDGDRDIFGKATDLFIWSIVVFLLLLTILGKYAWPHMLEGLKKREENIRAAIEDAHKAREESQKLREQLQADRDKLREQERQIMEEANKRAQTAADEIVAKARSEITVERDRLRREIQLATDQALQQIWHQAAGLATEISSKAIQRQLSPDDHRRLVDDALREMKIKNGSKA